MSDNRDTSNQCTASAFKTETQYYQNPRKTNIYKFLGDAYEGVGGFAGVADGASNKSYLTPDPSERMYMTRVSKSIYTNDFKPYVNSKVDPVFSKKQPHTVVTVGDSEVDEHHYLDWTYNVNGLSQTKDQFNNNVLRAAVRDEVCYVVMDMGPDNRPVVYMQSAGTVDPDSIVTSEWSELLQIGFVGSIDEDTDERYLWTREELLIQTSPSGDKGIINGGRVWKTIEQRPITIGRMPVYPVFANPRVDPSNYLPFPQSSSIAYLCHNIYDVSSNYEWILHKQAHDTMIFRNADIEEVGRGVEWGIKITDPAGGNADVYPYSPSADHPKNYLECIREKREQLKKLANENGVDTSESSTQAESGIAKAFTFQARNESIQKMLNVARSLDKWEAETYKAYWGEGEWEATTIYATNFQPEMDYSLGEIQDVAEVFDAAGIQTGKMEMLKLLARKVLEGNREAQIAVVDEIESRTGNID